MADPVIRKEVLREKIHGVLRRWILDGTLKPGERIVELSISRRLQVSRAPLREALWLLAHEGLVRIHPHKGAYVTRLSEEDIREIFEIRELLETRAALKAARRLDRAGEKRLKEAYLALKAAGDAKDITAFSAADLGFHRVLWSLSGSRHLEEVLGEISTRFFGFELIRDQPHRSRFRFDDMVQEHRRLMETVVEGNPSAIRAGFLKAFDAFLSYVLERFAPVS
jgi:DNA-binding GntR family transcriptional regulator